MPALSDQPPPGAPAEVPPPSGHHSSDVPRPVKLTLGEWFQGSPWWQKALVILPLLLVPFGGLLGALTGILLAIINLAVVRSQFGSSAKAAICVVVVFAGGIGFLLVGAIVTSMLSLLTGTPGG